MIHIQAISLFLDVKHIYMKSLVPLSDHTLDIHHCQDGMAKWSSSFANQFFLVIQKWDENLVPLIVFPMVKEIA